MARASNMYVEYWDAARKYTFEVEAWMTAAAPVNIVLLNSHLRRFIVNGEESAAPVYLIITVMV